jgi:altronate dehydratase small subunit
MNTPPASAGRYIHLHPADNTVTALADLAAGESVLFAGGPGPEEAVSFTLPGAVPYAHKFAAVLIPKGSDVVKYGEVIGEATADILPGEHVHVHNVVGKRARGG